MALNFSDSESINESFDLLLIDQQETTEDKNIETEEFLFEISSQFVCPNCGSENDLEDNFCLKCGQELSELAGNKKICKKCGTSIEPEDMFCYYCGSKIQLVIYGNSICCGYK